MSGAREIGSKALARMYPLTWSADGLGLSKRELADRERLLDEAERYAVGFGIAELEAQRAELLEALREVVRQWDSGGEPMESLSLGGVARAAIRRAEGGAK